MSNKKKCHVLYKDIEVLATYLDEVRTKIWDGELIPHQIGFASMYNSILDRAKRLYPKDEVIMNLNPVPLKETPEQFTLMKNIHLLRNHVEAESLGSLIDQLQVKLETTEKKLKRFHSIVGDRNL